MCVTSVHSVCLCWHDYAYARLDAWLFARIGDDTCPAAGVRMWFIDSKLRRSITTWWHSLLYYTLNNYYGCLKLVPLDRGHSQLQFGTKFAILAYTVVILWPNMCQNLAKNAILGGDKIQKILDLGSVIPKYFENRQFYVPKSHLFVNKTLNIV